MSAGGGFTRTGICTIVDMESLEIEIDVNESYINRVEPGQPVQEALRLEHHKKMQGRAKAQRKTLPDMPPADRGPGMGPGGRGGYGY